MNLQELREQLNIINDEVNPIGITVHLIKKNDDETETILKADISVELATELKEIFRATINNKFFDNQELVLREISSSIETVNSIFYYDLEEFPEKLASANNFDPFTEYQDFSFNNDDIESIKAILITVGNVENYFTIYKHVYPVTIVRQDRMLGFLPIGDRFEKLNSNILQINSSIDFLFANDNLFVNNIKTLSSAYGYNEIIKNQARQNITLIQDLDLIANIAELTAFVDNIKYAKRVLRINANSPVLQLAKLRIIEFITNHPKLSTKIRMNATNDRIMLDTDISKIITIGILNDDYLKSNLTDLDYESENKSEIDED
ncbi:anti-phage protein KwaB [Flavobacterium sp. LS2R12]|uniref:anti-phage protein KwaB n=1 Tax=unclassified Flavobacterium TaxID=196869 RepID=UPI003AB07BA2